jgi:hypothetical protein
MLYTEDDFEDNISPVWFWVFIVLVGGLVSSALILL